MKKILDVRKIAFYGCTGDNRAPESLPFPACLTSLMETIGHGGEIVQIAAHGTTYTKRCDNDVYLAASGMAFALLWDKNCCFSSLDVSQITPLKETVERAYAYAGYACNILSPTEPERANLFARVKASIDQGVPVLAFGLTDPPECAIIAGYDDDGVVIGWSHFQKNMPLEPESNGMFRLRDWEKKVWTLVFTGAQISPTLSPHDVIAHGVAIMSANHVADYLAGQAAYDEWINRISAAGELDDEGARVLYTYHHALLFTLAELRCWGGNFLRMAGAATAAKLFQTLHDTCWETDAAAAKLGTAALQSAELRHNIATLIGRLKALDTAALGALKSFLA